MTNKLLSIKCMKKKGVDDDDDDLGPSVVKRARASSYKYFIRGMHYKPAGVQIFVIGFCDAVLFSRIVFLWRISVGNTFNHMKTI